MNITNCTQCTTIQTITRSSCEITPENIVYSIICCIVILLVISGNLLVLFKIKPFQSRRNRPNIEVFIGYLSVFDLLASLFLIMDVYDNLTCFRKWPLGQVGCSLVYPLYHISLNMSVCILTIMSVDRFHSIVTPLKKKFTRSGIHMAVFISVCISISVQYYQFMHLKVTKDKKGDGYICTQNKMDRTYGIPRVINTLVRDFLFMAVFTVTSVVICRTVSNNPILDLYYTERKKKETRNVVKMLIVMEVVFTVLVVPYDMYDCMMFISHLLPGNQGIKFTSVLFYVDRVLTIMHMSNSFANCFVYAKMHKYIPLRSLSTSTSTEYHNNKRRSTSEYQHGDHRRSTKQEVIYTNSCYQSDDVCNM